MKRDRAVRILGGATLALVMVAGPATELAAQGGPGFLFRAPKVSLKLEGGYAVQFASSDIFDLTRRELTVSRSDFNTPTIGFDLAARLGERWDLSVGVSYGETSTRSEFREFEGTDDFPIEQVTTLQLVPAALTARYYLSDRGRSISRFAWVPNRFAPYMGVGIGVMSYDFEQSGEFVDYDSYDPVTDTYEIFSTTLISAGHAALYRALAGASLSLTNALVLTGELRYTYSQAEMSSDFTDFDPMDLSGVQGVVGIAVRF